MLCTAPCRILLIATSDRYLHCLEDVGHPARSLQVGRLEHFRLQRLPDHPQLAQSFGRVLVLFIEEDQDLVEAFQPWLVLDCFCNAEFKAVRDTVAGDEVVDLSAKLRRNTVVLPEVDARTICAQVDNLVAPIFDAGQLEH